MMLSYDFLFLCRALDKITMIDELYNRQILTMAGQVSHIGRLEQPQASVFKQAKYCGSTIHVDLDMQDGVVTAFAQELRACALGQAAAAIVAQQIIGTSATTLKSLHQTISAMLKEGGPPPQGQFQAFAMLQAAKDYKARHGSILLVLDAVVECIEKIEQKTMI